MCNNCNLPLHRLQKIEKPICKNQTYKDLVECVIIYHLKLNQSNLDKEAIIKIINEN